MKLRMNEYQSSPKAFVYHFISPTPSKIVSLVIILLSLKISSFGNSIENAVGIVVSQ